MVTGKCCFSGDHVLSQQKKEQEKTKRLVGGYVA